MKKLLVATIGILFTCSGLKLYAQDDFAQIQKEWGKDKRELVRMVMEMIPEDSIKFWPVYDKYEVERQKLGRERVMIIDDYAQHYMTMTSTKADELVTRIFKNEASLLKLQQQYYTSLKKALNAMQAAKFLQIESYLNGVLKVMLQEAIPVIGELDSLKKQM